MPFRIRTKLLVAFGVMLVPLLVLIAISHFNQKVIYQGVERVEELSRELAHLSGLQLSLDKLLMPPNDYLITGDVKEREEFDQLTKDVERRIEGIARLRVCSTCHAEPKGVIERVYGLEAEKGLPEEMEMLRGIVAGLKEIREKGDEIFAIKEPIGSAEGARLMEEMDGIAHRVMREYIDRHLETDRRRFEDAVNASRKAWGRSWVILLSGSMILVVLGVAFSIFYSALFVKPIETIHEGADSIAKGEFKTRLDIKTGDELQQLSNAMNEMAEQLDSFYGTLERQVEKRTRELRESEERYRVLGKTAPNAIICLRAPDTVSFWNMRAEEVFGYSEEDVAGKSMHDLIVPERYREKVREGLKNFFQTGTGPVVGKKTELSALRKDGTEFPIELSVSAMNIRGEWQATGIVRNITERKQAEEALRNSEERFRQLFDAGNDAVFVHGMTPEGKPTNFIEVNEVACKRLGYTRDELLKMSPLDIDASEMANQRAVVVEELLSNKKVVFEMEHVARDGKHVSVEISSRLFELKGQPMVLSIARDISERREAEESLRHERDMAQTYLNIAGVIFVVIDSNGKVSLVNKKGAEVLGYPEGEIIGKSWFDEFLPERFRDEIRGVHRKLMSGEDGSLEYIENPVLTRGGEERVIAWHNAVLKDDAGEIIATLSSGEDITERKKAEEALKQRIDELEQFRKVTIKRELRIEELQRKVEEMEKKLGVRS